MSVKNQPSYQQPSTRSVMPAFQQTLISLLYPKVWFAMLVPILTLILGMILLGAILWSHISELISWALLQVNFLQNVNAWFAEHIGFGIKSGIVGIATFFTIVALAGVISMIVSLLIVDTILVKHVQNKRFSSLQAKGITTKQDIKNTLFYAGLLLVTWVIGIPLWVFPPFALIWQFFWTAYFFSKTLPFDCLCDYADSDELKAILKQYRKQNLRIGYICALANYIPGASFIISIFSILWFSHYNFAALEELRRPK